LPDQEKKREGRTHSDVITVPSHTKKDNPKAALKPVRAVSDATALLRRHFQ